MTSIPAYKVTFTGETEEEVNDNIAKYLSNLKKGANLPDKKTLFLTVIWGDRYKPDTIINEVFNSYEGVSKYIGSLFEKGELNEPFEEDIYADSDEDEDSDHEDDDEYYIQYYGAIGKVPKRGPNAEYIEKYFKPSYLEKFCNTFRPFDSNTLYYVYDGKDDYKPIEIHLKLQNIK